jgi:L-lactate dehydrogenase complex protein LldE
MFPEAGKATVTLLERLGVEVAFPESQGCCGQMHVNSGFPRDAVPMIRSFVDAFEGFDHIVAPSGSCVGSIRHQHEGVARKYGDARLVAAVRETAPKVLELTEFITDVLGLENVGAVFPHRVAYHASCHSLRVASIGDRPYRLLQQVRGLELLQHAGADQCCGFGGTFSVKNSGVSTAMVTDKARAVAEVNPEFLVSVDSSCLMNIGGALAKRGSTIRTLHLAEVLAAGGQ